MKTPSKKLPWFTAGTLVLTTFILACAQEPESTPGTPLPQKRVTLGEPGYSSDEVPPKATAHASLENIEIRLKALEAQLDLLITRLAEADKATIRKSDLDVVKNDLEAYVDDRLPVKSNPQSPVTPSGANPKSEVAIKVEKQLAVLDETIGDLGIQIGRIQQRLGLDNVKAQPGKATELNIVDELQQSRPPVKRTAFIVIRNRTGEAQSFFVEGSEWRIPGDSAWYDIPVTLIGEQDSVMGQVWPFDKPKKRVFSLADGRFESRVDITLRRVE